ncbi:MAG: peptidoglycan editing factor PgeF [Rhodanobacteraceae bacterium]
MTDSNWIIPDWPAPANVRAAVTTRLLPGNSRPPFDAFNLGVGSGEDAGVVAANRAALQRTLGLPSAPRWLHQVHGTTVAQMHETRPVCDEREPAADAAIAHAGDIVLAVLTADCLPVLICAEDGSEIAAIHAGWRGLAAGVIEATLDRLNTPREHLLAWLGPAIAATSYEVGEEVRAAFVHAPVMRPGAENHSSGAVVSDPAAAFEPVRPGHWQCNLELLARQRLAAHRVTRIHGGGFDTVTDRRFYSHRRDGRTGRFASLIWRTTSRSGN